MSGRKIDYFGTFLDSMTKKPAPATDPANAVLKALRAGDKSADELIPHVGSSASRFISVTDQLINADWIKKHGDLYSLTDAGRKVAAVLD
jgi:predicted transcriptional regulator